MNPAGRLVRQRGKIDDMQPRSRGFPAEGGLLGQSFYGWLAEINALLHVAIEPVSTGSHEHNTNRTNAAVASPALKGLAYEPAFGRKGRAALRTQPVGKPLTIEP